MNVPGTTSDGDHAADPFRALYEANREQVRRLLARMVGTQEAEDLVQIVFAKVAEALPQFRGDAESSTWLYRIATNVAHDHLRGRSANEARATVSLDETTVETSERRLPAPDAPSSLQQELIRKEMRSCIRDAIDELPEHDRAVLVPSALAGLSDGEVARIAGISPGSARVRLHRARARLKQSLESRCDFYRDEDNEFACDSKSPPAGGPPQDPKTRGDGGPRR